MNVCILNNGVSAVLETFFGNLILISQNNHTDLLFITLNPAEYINNLFTILILNMSLKILTCPIHVYKLFNLKYIKKLTRCGNGRRLGHIKW